MAKNMFKLVILNIFIVVLLSSFVSAVPSGGVSYWNFSSVTDKWGSNDGTNNGATSDSNCVNFTISGSSCPDSFDFTNDWVAMGNDASLDITGDGFALSVWVKADAVSGDYRIAMYPLSEGAGSIKYGVYLASSSRLQGFILTENGAVTSTTSTFSDTSNWHHIVLNYNGAFQELWLDNTTVDNDTQTGNINATIDGSFWIGKFGSSFTQYFNGKIDEVKIFNRALTPTEISNIYAYGVSDPISNVAPTIELLDPTQNNTHTNDDPVRFAFRMTNDNNTELTNCTITVGGVLKATYTGITNDTVYDYNFTSLSEAEHTFSSSCTDLGGTTNTGNYKVVVDRTAPVFSINTVETDNSSIIDRFLYNITLDDNITDLYLDNFYVNINSTNGTNYYNDNDDDMGVTSKYLSGTIDIGGWSTGNYIIEYYAGDFNNSLNYRYETYTFSIKANAPPNITSTIPVTQFINTFVGNNINFITNATEPDGEPLTYKYYFNGSLNHTGASYTFLVPNVTGEYEHQVVVSDNNSLSSSYNWTLNISVAPPFVVIDAKNLYDSSSLTDFEIYVTNNPTTYFNDSGIGSITTDLSPSANTWHNITFVKSGFFNRTYLINPSLNGSFTGFIFQNIVNPVCFDIFNNSVVCDSPVYVDSGVNDLVLSADGYYDLTRSTNLSGLSNVSLNFYGFYSTNLSITSVSAYGSPSYCNYSLNNSLYPSYFGFVNGSPSTSIGLVNGSFSVVADCEGYAYGYESVVIENVTHSLTFNLFTVNSFNFIFRDAVSLALLSSNNVTLDLISDSFSNNYSTNNGTLYIDLLSPEFYTIRFNGVGYSERFYYFSLLDKSFNNLTLYLLNSSVSSNITVTITNENNKRLIGAYLKVLRYNLESNAYLLQEIYKTDVEGKAYIEAERDVEFYKFYIDYPFGTTVFFGQPDYIETNTLTIPVLLSSLYADKFFSSLGVTGNITFNNATNNFRWDYSDSLNTLAGACLYVYRVSLTEDTLLNSSCADTSSGTILVPLTPVNDSNYIAVGNILLGSDYYYWGEKHLSVGAFTDENSKKFRLALILFISFVLIFIFSYDVTLMFVVMPLPLFVGSITEFVEFDKTIAIGFFLVAMVLAYWTNKK